MNISFNKNGNMFEYFFGFLQKNIYYTVVYYIFILYTIIFI